MLKIPAQVRANDTHNAIPTFTVDIQYLRNRILSSETRWLFYSRHLRSESIRLQHKNSCNSYLKKEKCDKCLCELFLLFFSIDIVSEATSMCLLNTALVKLSLSACKIESKMRCKISRKSVSKIFLTVIVRQYLLLDCLSFYICKYWR